MIYNNFKHFKFYFYKNFYYIKLIFKNDKIIIMGNIIHEIFNCKKFVGNNIKITFKNRIEHINILPHYFIECKMVTTGMQGTGMTTNIIG